jgi:hypothetical protein
VVVGMNISHVFALEVTSYGPGVLDPEISEIRASVTTLTTSSVVDTLA